MIEKYRPTDEVGMKGRLKQVTINAGRNTQEIMLHLDVSTLTFNVRIITKVNSTLLENIYVGRKIYAQGKFDPSVASKYLLINASAFECLNEDDSVEYYWVS